MSTSLYRKNKQYIILEDVLENGMAFNIITVYIYVYVKIL